MECAARGVRERSSRRVCECNTPAGKEAETREPLNAEFTF